MGLFILRPFCTIRRLSLNFYIHFSALFGIYLYVNEVRKLIINSSFLLGTQVIKIYENEKKKKIFR